MKSVVFTGPTLPAADVLKVLDAEILPPVAQGDVYRVARDGPMAIGIIDGYFDGVPSVWHKEILWAMEQGITVFGSASMGALRAAELKDFGMIGVGTIYEAYRDGDIADDDEVAVLHSPAELGFVVLSEPMVSVRATIRRALAEQVLTATMAELVISKAKRMHYRDRTWDGIVKLLDGKSGFTEFLAWLPDRKVDAKREDACAMLAQMAAFAHEDKDDAPQTRKLERTLVWQSLVRRIDSERSVKHVDAKAVLDELRLDPIRYESFREKAAMRVFALEDAKRRGADLDRDTLHALMDRHRRQQKLPRRDAVLRWLHENDLDEHSYEALLVEAGLVEQSVTARSGSLDKHILAELRWTGDYSELKDRADAKARLMNKKRDAAASPDRLRMLIWFFENRLGRFVPDDLEAYALSIGLADRDELFELIGREFMYCFNHTDPSETGKTDQPG